MLQIIFAYGLEDSAFIFEITTHTRLHSANILAKGKMCQSRLN